jgi:S-adenosylmethionine:tRNA ribosyltransferase-isomerase
MRVDEFNYDLPVELIAQHPSEKRESSKMMVLDRHGQTIKHDNFNNITTKLTPDDLIVVNNTRVINARLFGKKETGGLIEIFLLKKVSNDSWQCLLRPNKRIRPETKIILKDNSFVKALYLDEENKWVIETPEEFDTIIENIGTVPLPPYIKREAENEFQQIDKDRYQTIYAKEAGAVAAPTAGLHFTPEIINKLKTNGIKIVEITLHVGLGTFKPVKCENVTDHIMHSEFYSVDQETAEIINQHKSENKKILAVGTTSIRTLETIANANNGIIKASSGWSQIFIYPGYKFSIIDSCITNFHLPASTLIMLVSAFAGKDFIFKAYKEAIENHYRFFSYGDCMLIR